jgi:hypothetical protein
MSLKLVSGMMRASGDEALLIMERDVGGDEIVLVAIGIADPPVCNECRFQQYVAIFSAIASRKFDNGDSTADGRIVITAADVSAWKADHADTT